jgi:hypothetical protein
LKRASITPSFDNDIMAGLETAAAIIGIADVGYKGVSALYDFLGKMKKAPEEVDKLKRETGALDSALGTLKDLQLGSVDEGVHDRLRRICLADTVNNCGEACRDLQSKLVKWNNKGENHFLSKLQTASHEKELQRYTATISCTTGTAQLAISTATL